MSASGIPHPSLCPSDHAGDPSQQPSGLVDIYPFILPSLELSTMYNTFLSLHNKPRHTKSTSDLSQPGNNDIGKPVMQWQGQEAARSRDRLAVTREHQLKSLPVPQSSKSTRSKQRQQQTKPPPPPGKPVMKARATTTPSLHPPDELYLKMIRRRSANARLEEQRIQHEQRFYGAEELMSVAIASALPPQYFDSPSAIHIPYSNLQVQPLVHSNTHPKMKPRMRLTLGVDEDKSNRDEESLRAQIDDTIAQYAMLKVTQATPTSTRSISPMSATISPMNDIDYLYLEKRKKKR